MTRHLFPAITLAALAACAVEPTDEVAESATVQAATPVQDINAAEATFRSAVVQNVTASATAAGVGFASTGIKLGYHPRNRTVAAGRTTTNTQAVFLSRSVARRSGGSYAPGLYELSLGSAGPQVHHYHPTLGKILVAPPPAPVGFHTPFGDDVCPDAPSGLADYCQRIAACFAYELFC